MPFAALVLLNAAAGLAAAVFYARELRASPRASWTLPGFAALCLHEALVALPAVFYLLARHTDWMLSYALPTGSVPSAGSLVLSVVVAVVALGSFILGARLVRDQHARLPGVVAAGLAGLALVTLAAMRARVGAVGTTSQFRGGFGMVPFWSSRASTAVLLVGMIQAAAFGHLAWTLTRARRPLLP
jgi:hypothetical protein